MLNQQVFLVWIQPDRPARRPVAGGTAPPTGMLPFRLGIDGVSPGQHFIILACMPLTWGDEPYGTVTVFVVVLCHEAGHPLLGRLQALVAVLWIVGPVLAGPEQRLREGIVIGYLRTTVRWGNIQSL